MTRSGDIYNPNKIIHEAPTPRELAQVSKSRLFVNSLIGAGVSSPVLLHIPRKVLDGRHCLISRLVGSSPKSSLFSSFLVPSMVIATTAELYRYPLHRAQARPVELIPPMPPMQLSAHLCAQAFCVFRRCFVQQCATECMTRFLAKAASASRTRGNPRGNRFEFLGHTGCALAELPGDWMWHTDCTRHRPAV